MKSSALTRLFPRLGLAAVMAAAIYVAPVASAEDSATQTQVQYLSGHGADDAVLWDFYCTDGRHSGVWSKIHVPSCWEQEGFGTYNYGIELRGHNGHPPATEKGKYRYHFYVPADWKGRVVRIVFDGSMTDTRAWINGKSAGPVHQGAFYRFKYNITNSLNYGGDNLLEVTVAKESANKSVNAAERRADYWNFGGIFRPVYLEALPAHYIDRTAVDAEANGQFTADVFLGRHAGATAEAGEVTAQVVTEAGKPVGDPFKAAVAPGADKVRLRAKLADVKLWTSETPNLYKVRFTLVENGRPEHTVTDEFGFRTFEVRKGDGIYLNGHKIRLKGICHHSLWPESGRTGSRRLNYEDVRIIKEMNMNAVRMTHYPPDEDFLNACDRLGLYVLDELGGWHGHYDTTVGKKLVSEMVRRDVNHPSILFWDNGNETGWNTALDGEFDKWDIQKRTVLHPLGTFNGIATMHYRSYGQTEQYLRQPEIFMPTEFLHGLYDGGHGAGLYDYWKLMRNSPRCAGGFLWVFQDQGIVRTDENGRIDTDGNHGADGIVGPHREREGSFYTVRQVWAPVQLGPDTLPVDFSGALSVENRYFFNNLNQCTFDWSLANFPKPGQTESGHSVIAAGEMKGPDVGPQSSGTLQLHLPTNWRDADVLYVTAKNPQGQSIWTWSWSWKKNAAFFGPAPAASDRVEVSKNAAGLAVTAGKLELTFDGSTGELSGVVDNGKPISLGNGPRFIAARRGDRTLDGTIDPDAKKGVDRIYDDISGTSKLTSLATRRDGNAVVVEADYFGPMKQALWHISPDGTVRLDYKYEYNGYVELMGIQFDYPEKDMKSIRWLGMGPYRVWQNRLRGTTLDVWQNAYNNTTPTVSFVYPEFKGYFRDWRWANFSTAEGHLTMENETPGTYLGVYTPEDGPDHLLFTLPKMGLSVLDIIPAIRNKVNATDLVGPSSQAHHVHGVKSGTILFHFKTR